MRSGSNFDYTSEGWGGWGVTLPVSTLLADTFRLNDHVSQHSYIWEFYVMAAVLIRPLSVLRGCGGAVAAWLVSRHCDACKRGHCVVLKALGKAFQNTPRLNGVVQSTRSTKDIYSPGTSAFSHRPLKKCFQTAYHTPQQINTVPSNIHPLFLFGNDYIFRSKIPPSRHRYKNC